MVNSTALKIALPKHILGSGTLSKDDRQVHLNSLALYKDDRQVHLNSLALYKDDRQVHLNSLALYAADWYLKCLQFETRADWWMPYLTHSATLELAKIGKLECIPVVGDAMIATISPDLKDDRVGYLFVRINEALTSAEIIGFMPEYSYQVELVRGASPVGNRLQSTDDLIDYLCDLESAFQPIPVIKIADWLVENYGGVWQDINTLPLTPAYVAYRSKPKDISVKSIECGQEIKLGDEPDSPAVILTIRNEQMDEVNLAITLGISPGFPATELPIDLKFIVRDGDEQGEEIKSFESKAGDFYGEMVLGGKKGKKISLEIEFDQVKKIGTFEVGC